MIDSGIITLTNAVPYTFPDDHPKHSVKGLDSYRELTISMLTTTSLSIEEDYGLGFGTPFVQTDSEVTYLSPNVRKIRITPTVTGTGKILLSRPLGGL